MPTEPTARELIEIELQQLRWNPPTSSEAIQRWNMQIAEREAKLRDLPPARRLLTGEPARGGNVIFSVGAVLSDPNTWELSLTMLDGEIDADHDYNPYQRYDAE